MRKNEISEDVVMLEIKPLCFGSCDMYKKIIYLEISTNSVGWGRNEKCSEEYVRRVYQKSISVRISVENIRRVNQKSKSEEFVMHNIVVRSDYDR